MAEDRGNCQIDNQQMDVQMLEVNDISHLHSLETSMPLLEAYMDSRLDNFFDPLTLKQEKPFNEFTIRQLTV